METIHVKTVDPVSKDLLGAAASRGIDLNWDRHERLQPQDGFVRSGLSCPFGCLQGPCRIDPFGRGADLGSCGLDRHGMVAATLLRLSLNGALEALADATEGAPSWSGPLGEKARAAVAKLGGGTVSAGETFAAAAALRRPDEPPEALIRRAVRLGILTLGVMNGTAGAGSCRAGYGLLAGATAVIGICGAPPGDLVAALRTSGGATVVSLGDWIGDGNGFVPFACTSGEAELLLSSGRIDLVLCGPGNDPAVPALCAKLGVPVVVSTAAPKARDIIAAAVKSRESGAPSAFEPDASALGEGTVCSPDSLKQEVGGAGLALIGGCDTPQQSLGWVASEVAPALRGKDLAVAAWGDAALWLVKAGQAGAANVIADPLVAVAAGLLDSVRGVCFTGLKGCRDLAVALGLAALGARVCVVPPIPLWGSKAVMDGLSESLAAEGGSLAHFPQPPGANEVLDWFAGH